MNRATAYIVAIFVGVGRVAELARSRNCASEQSPGKRATAHLLSGQIPFSDAGDGMDCVEIPENARRDSEDNPCTEAMD